MADIDDLFGEFLGPATIPAPKPQQVAIAAENKRMDLGMGYRSGAEADLGLTDTSMLVDELLNPTDPVTAAQQNQGRGQYMRDSSRQRSWGEVAVDAPVDVINGLFQGVLGLGALGAGVVDNDAGATVAGWGEGLNDFAQSIQSDDLNAERRALGARNEVSAAENERLYQEDIAKGQSNLLALLKREGRNFVDAISNQDSATLGSGTASGVGSLLAGGVIGKGLKALGVASRFAMPGAIGALEGGGAYQSTVSEVMAMSHDQLMAGSPEYAQLLAQGVSPDEAKTQIANDAGLMAGLIQAPIGVATGALVSKFEAAPFKVPSLGSAAGNIAREGLEEGLQGASGEIASNVAIGQTADINRDASEGVGAAAGEGALFGLGTAGAVQAPGIPVRAGISTVQGVSRQVRRAYEAGKDAILARGDRVLADAAEEAKGRTKLAPGVLDAAATQMAQDAAQPGIWEDIGEALSTKVAPEEQPKVQDHIDRLRSLITIDNEAEAAEQANPLIAQNVAEATDRFDAVRRMSSLAVDQQLDPENRLAAGLYVFDAIKQYENLFLQDLPDAIHQTKDEDPRLAQLREFESIVVNLQEHEELKQVIGIAAKMAADLKPADVVDATTAEVAAHAIEAFPEQAKLDVAEAALFHAEELSPARRIGLQLQVERLKAEQDLKDRAKELRLDWKTVSKEVLTDADNDPKNKTPSAMGHFNRIMQAVSQKNSELAAARMKRFMDFAQHMTNKVEALNENYAEGKWSKDHRTGFQQLMPNGVFRPAQVGLWVNPRSGGPVANAQMVEANAKAVVSLANRLAASLPELGVKPIAEPKLVDGLQGAVEEVLRRHKNPEPKQQKSSEPAQPAGQSVEGESVSAEAAPAEAALPAVDQAEVERFVDDYLAGKGRDDPAVLQFLVNNSKAVEAEFARRKTEQEKAADVSGKVEQTEEKVEAEVEQPVEKVEETSVETQTEEVEQVEEVEPEVELTGLEAVYSGLHSIPGKIKNWFYEAYRIPSKPKSRLAGKTDVAQLVLEALASTEQFAAFQGKSVKEVRGTLSPEVSKAYVSLFGMFNPIEAEMDRRLDAYLSKDAKRLAALTEGNEDESQQITSWLAARVTNLVQQDGKKFRYHPELANMAILAGLNWAITAQQRQRVLDDEDVAKILDVSISEVARNPWTLEFFNGGIWASQAKQDLARKIKAFWGVSDNRDAPMGYTEGLAEAMAAEVLLGMQQAGLIQLEKSPKFRSSNDQIREYTRLVIQPNEALQIAGRYPDAIEQLVREDADSTNYIGSAPTKVATHQMRNGLVKTTRQQRKVIERAQNIEHRINVPNWELFQAIGLDGLKELFGGGEVDRTKINRNYADSLDGQNKTIELAFQGLEQLTSETQNWAEANGKSLQESPIFYEFGISKVGRLHMLGGVNPQANKLVREVVLPTFTKIDLSDPQNRELFLLAIGQHLGIKVHKQTRGKTLLKVEEMLGKLAPVMGDLTNVSLLKQTFAEAGADLTPGALHALNDYVRSQALKDGELFETSLYIEADGVTDGPINALMHMATNGFSAHWLKMMQKGGLYVGPNGAAALSFNQYSEADAVDLYEETVMSLDRQLGLVTLSEDVNRQRNALFHLLAQAMPGDVQFDPEKGELTIKRGITKNPLTVSIYGSGAKGIADKISGEVIALMYEKISKGEIDPLLNHAFGVLTTKRVFSEQGVLRLVPTKEAGADLTKNVPVSYSFTPGMVKNLEANILHLFVGPMRAAISETIGETTQVTENMRDAVQIQSIFLVHAFQQGINDALDRKEKAEKAAGSGWKRHDFLSPAELKAVYDQLKHLSPFVDTGTQTFFMAAKRKAELDNDVGFGRGLGDELRAPGLIEGPGYAGVKGIPTMIIGPGDGQAVQNLYTDPAMPANLAVFDGINFGLDGAVDGSNLVNKAVLDGWKRNPFADVSASFTEFVANADMSSLSPEAISKLVEAAFPPEHREGKGLVEVQQRMAELAADMQDDALVIQARHNVLAKVDLSVDHMATVEAPYVQEGSIKLQGANLDRLADELNLLAADELQRLIDEREGAKSRPLSQNISKDLAELGELDERTGARVASIEELQRAVRTMHIPVEQKGLLKDVLKALSASEHTLVFGDLNAIIKDREINDLPALAFDPSKKINGFILSGENRVYLVNPSSETLVHELIHAATLDTLRVFYHSPGSLSQEQRAAIQRIEQLANQWLKDDFSDLPDETARRAYRNAYRAVTDHLNAGRKALALNEFMTWNLTNQSLIAKGRRTPVTRKLAQLTKAVIDGIKQLIWGKAAKIEEVGQDFFSNLRFNTQVLIYSSPTIQAQLAEAAAFHSEEFGNDARLIDIRRGYARKVGHWLGKRPDPVLVSRFGTMIQNAQNVTAEFQTAFRMSGQEASTFRMIVAALATETAFNPNSMARIQQLYRHVTDQLKVEDFMADPEANEPNDRYQAQNKLNTLLGHHLTGRDLKNRSHLLPSFLALATTNDQFRRILGKTPLPKSPKNGEKTLDAFLENEGVRRMDQLSQLLSGEGRKDDVEAAIDALTVKMLEEISAQQAFVDEKLKLAGNWIDRSNQKVVDWTNEMSAKAYEAMDAKQQEISNRWAKNALEAGKALVSLVNEENAEAIQEGVIAAANKSNGFRILAEAAAEVVGRTNDNATVIDMIKLVRSIVQKTRQQFREYLPKQVNSHFSRELTEDEQTAMYQGMAKTDLAALHGSFSMVRIMRMLENPALVDTEVGRLEEHLATEPNWEKWQGKAKQLAHYMNTGQTGSNLLRNANAVAQLFGEMPERLRRSTVQPTPTQVKALDRLISLYALQGLDQSTKDALASLAQNEATGLQFVMSYLIGQRKDELDKVTASAMGEFNHLKGHVTTENDGGTAMIVAKDSEAAQLQQLGFVRVADYEGSAAELGAPAKGYYFAPIASRAMFHQGLAQNVRLIASGVDPDTGYQVGGTAGVIEDPTVIAGIARRLRHDTAGNEPLMPVYNPDGSIAAYERSLDPVQQARLDINTNMAEVLGVWRGRQVEEYWAGSLNRQLVANLKSMWDSEKNSRRDEYINLFGSEAMSDPVLKDAVKLFTPQFRQLVSEEFPSGQLWVRKDLVNNVVGYRNPSIGDAYTGVSRWSEETRNQARRVAAGVFGKDAIQTLLKIERGYQTFVTDARVTIVVKSVIVPVANILSNMLHLVSRGVPMKTIATQFPKKTAEVDQFVKGQIERIKLEGELRAAEGRNDIVGAKKLKAQLQSIRDANRRLSIWPLIERGELASISDVGISHEEIQLSEGRLSAYLEKLTSKLPPQLRTAARYGMVARDTALFKGLQRAVEYGDFLAKAVLYDDLIGRQGKTHDEAMGAVTQEFINYDYLPGRWRTGLESNGLLWFWNFKLRAIKVAVSVLKNNPLHLLMSSMIPVPEMFGSIGTPVTDNLVSIGLQGDLGWSVGLDQSLHAHTLNPWVNLWT